MRKLLCILSLVSSTVLISSCAYHNVDFNDDRDVITCKDGSYTVSKNSTKEEILSSCRGISFTPHPELPSTVDLEFWADHNAWVKCRLEKDRVKSCSIKR